MSAPDAKAVLPILEKEDEIVRAIRSSQVVIVAGETGSGKTTRLPLICRKAGLGKRGVIGVTQPRRIAALSVAAYVAKQLSCPLGSLVGYKVRFTDRESAQTRIKFMTDGILLRELQADRRLGRYEAVIIDEVHERSLNIDFLLGYMKRLLPQRPDLRLVLSSATIDTELFSAAFKNAPVITVSGRLFPVDILHQEPAAQDDGEVSYVNAAADAARELLESSDSGDILVFMPTERDIRETQEILAGRLGRACAVAPLFGRMPLAEQEAVFRPFNGRKIIVATNIAETSLTVPNVRFVVDTGLARVKRYDPASGVTRLPVDAVSQASARQRAGRCGRVRNGMCVRLYSEQDLLSRPLYTPPEILRSNLGQVILSMTSLGLGPVEDFPFLQPPSKQAVSHGYRSLVELGALDDKRNLTDAGRRMARFPVDPAVSRMLLAAHEQRCVPEMLVIASALSVQDVRIRPGDKKELADAAHAGLCDPLSDFLFYLKVWDACGWAGADRPSLSRLRKFCNQKFLSFIRVREWKDIHDQLASLSGEKAAPRRSGYAASYEQIHRCIAAGFISHVGRKNDDGTYRIAKDRTSAIFPGSALYKKKPDWIVSCDLVETSRLYSRTCASIDPLWLETIAPHLCKRRYTEPFFDPETGGVKAKETVSFFGLTIVANRTVGYGRINPAEANEVFIREGLCTGRLDSAHRFYKHNQEMQERAVSFEKKLRTTGIYAGEEAVEAFYKSRLPGVTSIHELNAFLRTPGASEPLFMKESDLLAEGPGDLLLRFPDSVTVGTAVFPVTYEFDPSSELDGACVRVSARELSHVNKEVFDWVVPGQYEPRIRFLLESLPKSAKQKAGDTAEAARRIAASIHWDGRDFLDAVSESASTLLGLSLNPAELPVHDLPQHLMVKVLVGKYEKATEQDGNATLWLNGSRQWSKRDMRTWSVGDLPRKVEVIRGGTGFSVFGFPSLLVRNGSVDCTVFVSADQQACNHSAGVRRLVEICLEKEFAWLERDAGAAVRRFAGIIKGDTIDCFKTALISLVKDYCLGDGDLQLRKRTDFDVFLEFVRARLASAGREIGPLLSEISSRYSTLAAAVKAGAHKSNSRTFVLAVSDLKNELASYLDRLRTGSLNYAMLEQYPRYFKAFGYRIQRALSDPAKYLSKVNMASPYLGKTAAFFSNSSESDPFRREAAIEFGMMVEEFKISLFAQQEVKTIFPVSLKRLDEKLAEMEKASSE